jgi:hypothetical protein
MGPLVSALAQVGSFHDAPQRGYCRPDYLLEKPQALILAKHAKPNAAGSKREELPCHIGVLDYESHKVWFRNL